VPVDSRTPVTEVEGVGPEMGRALARIKVHTVYDLLRCTPDLIRRTAPHLSFQQAFALRAAASLMQVRGMTAQAAEALVRAGVKSIDELQGKSVRDITAILRGARRRRLIRSVPDSRLVEAMLKDATVLHYTGAIAGTVRDSKGTRVRGASVTIGRHEARTDARGRFHLLRLPLGRRVPLRIDHPRFRELVVEEPRLALDSDLVAVQEFTLERFRGRRKPMPPQPSLSELNGDTLPTPTGQPFKVVPIRPSQLHEREILMVQQVPAGRGEVKLVCRLRAYERGAFIVRTVQVSKEQLPHPLAERDHVRFVRGEFRPVKVDARTMRREIALRSMRAEFRHQTIKGNVSAANRRKAVRERLAFLARKGFFSGRLQRER